MTSSCWASLSTAGLLWWLTDGGEDSGGEVEGAGELPLDAGLVGNTFDNNSGDNFEVLVTDVVFAFEHVLVGVEGHLLLVLVLGLEGVEDRGADQ